MAVCQKRPASWQGRDCNCRKEWEYLKPIAKTIVQNDDVRIRLLIGANCMKALEPMQEMAIESCGLYAYKTRLRWYIVGPIMNGDNKDSISCHWVAVRDASTSHVESNHFGIKNSMKNIALEEMFKIMYKNDFSEPVFLQAKLWWAAITCQ